MNDQKEWNSVICYHHWLQELMMTKTISCKILRYKVMAENRIWCTCNNNVVM